MRCWSTGISKENPNGLKVAYVLKCVKKTTVENCGGANLQIFSGPMSASRLSTGHSKPSKTVAPGHSGARGGGRGRIRTRKRIRPGFGIARRFFLQVSLHFVNMNFLFLKHSFRLEDWGCGFA